MPIELPKSLVEQLPVAALFVLCAAVAGRYAARLVDRLVAAQLEAQAQLILALERNTAAWRDACAALVRLELAVTGRSRRRSGRQGGRGDLEGAPLHSLAPTDGMPAGHGLPAPERR